MTVACFYDTKPKPGLLRQFLYVSSNSHPFSLPLTLLTWMGCRLYQCGGT